MSSKKPEKPESELPPETDAEILAWARSLKKAAGIGAVRLLIAQYRQIARNEKASEYDRQVARQRLRNLLRIK